jgi:hypothetical protein
MDSDTFRDLMAADFLDGDDLAGVAIGLALWLALFIAAPLVVLVLAALLFSIELPFVLALGAIVIAARLLGAIPWNVVVTDALTGHRHVERYRLLWRAARRVRDINGKPRVSVIWV